MSSVFLMSFPLWFGSAVRSMSFLSASNNVSSMVQYLSRKSSRKVVDGFISILSVMKKVLSLKFPWLMVSSDSPSLCMLSSSGVASVSISVELFVFSLGFNVFFFLLFVFSIGIAPRLLFREPLMFERN